MERLNFSASIEEGFRRILEEEKLDDLSQFYREGFFDEVPLFSRHSQLSFLKGITRERADFILLRFSLKYLHRVIHQGAPTADFLAAVTFNSYSKQEFMVPHIFVCHGRVDELLKGVLLLRAPRSVFAIRLLGLLSEISDAGRYQVLQDTLTVPRKARVFIGPRHLPRPSMVGIDALGPARKPGNGRAMRVK